MAKKFWIEVDAINIPAIVFSESQPRPSADGKEFIELTDPDIIDSPKINIPKKDNPYNKQSL